jgi:osmotically-inducible protein OsmY
MGAFHYRARAKSSDMSTPPSGVVNACKRQAEAEAGSAPRESQGVNDMTLRILVALLMLPACGSMTGRSTGRYIDDKTINAQVKTKLIGEKASNLTRIGVNTVNGVVHLDGVVDSVRDKIIAEELARQVGGVTNVVNQLQVNSSGSASPR